jgi:signal peptidase I
MSLQTPTTTETASIASILTTTTSHFNVTFLDHSTLLGYSRSKSVASEILSAVASDGSMHSFRVLVYPRGGGHVAKNKVMGQDKADEETSGFGMSYKVLPMFGTRDERVGVYLQYLPVRDSDTIDATFDLRLRGTQSKGRRFDIMWSAGMRFVSVHNSNLAQGTASDFGAHLMQTPMLESFMGAEEDSANPAEPLVVQLRLTLHPPNREAPSILGTSSYISTGPLDDIRHTDRVRTGTIVVPVLKRLAQRNRMFELGAYPGVEYRIMRIMVDGKEVFESCPNCQYEMRPIYPLVAELERHWPIVISETEIPRLYTANMYNIISAIGSLFTATVGLTTAFVLSQAISFLYIPSHSMDPTLQVGNVLLVEKVTPRWNPPQIGDVVLFSPPAPLRDIVSSNGGRISDRDLFVKRVAAGPGDLVTVTPRGQVMVVSSSTAMNQQKGGTAAVNAAAQGNRELCDVEPLKLIEKYVIAGETVLKNDEVFVQGDCSFVSIDSRVWGPLKFNQIVGKPLFRIWPLEKFGRVPDLAVFSETEWTE